MIGPVLQPRRHLLVFTILVLGAIGIGLGLGACGADPATTVPTGSADSVGGTTRGVPTVDAGRLEVLLAGAVPAEATGPQVGDRLIGVSPVCNQVRYLADGTRALSWRQTTQPTDAVFDQSIHCWDLAERRCVWTWTSAGPIVDVLIAPNAAVATVWHGVTPSPTGKRRTTLIDLHTGKVLQMIGQQVRGFLDGQRAVVTLPGTTQPHAWRVIGIPGCEALAQHEYAETGVHASERLRVDPTTGSVWLPSADGRGFERRDSMDGTVHETMLPRPRWGLAVWSIEGRTPTGLLRLYLRPGGYDGVWALVDPTRDVVLRLLSAQAGSIDLDFHEDGGLYTITRCTGTRCQVYRTADHRLVATSSPAADHQALIGVFGQTYRGRLLLPQERGLTESPLRLLPAPPDTAAMGETITALQALGGPERLPAVIAGLVAAHPGIDQDDCRVAYDPSINQARIEAPFQDLGLLQVLTDLQDLTLAQTRAVDLSWVRNLRQLIRLDLHGTLAWDLTPLGGLSLTNLTVPPLTHDLSPLTGMPLAGLVLADCMLLDDLSPVVGMGISRLDLGNCVSLDDLTPLTGMPLTRLDLTGCSALRDLAPVASCPLQEIVVARTVDLDLTPLAGCPTLASLSGVSIHPGPFATRGLAALRNHPTLKTISLIGVNGTAGAGLPIQDFWQAVDAGKVVLPVASAPSP